MSLFSITLAVLICVACAAYCVYESQTLRERLRDVETTKLDIADLTDRFTGFQKRDGMRKVRAERTSEADTLAELQNAVQQQQLGLNGTPSTKDALRRRLRSRTH
jgi:hypothetical protein